MNISRFCPNFFNFFNFIKYVCSSMFTILENYWVLSAVCIVLFPAKRVADYNSYRNNFSYFKDFIDKVRYDPSIVHALSTFFTFFLMQKIKKCY